MSITKNATKILKQSIQKDLNEALRLFCEQYKHTNDRIKADLLINPAHLKEKLKPIRSLLYRINRDFKKLDNLVAV